MKLFQPYEEGFGTAGLHPIFTPEQPLKWLRLDLLTVTEAVGEIAVGGEGDEMALVILTGTVTVRTPDEEWHHLGDRDSVFAGSPTTVYLPSDKKAWVKSEGGAAEIAVCHTPAPAGGTAEVVYPQDVEVVRRGQNHWQREVRNVLTESQGPTTSSLVLGETINDPGEWSGYPPHKHDTSKPGEENVFEEVYYYRTDPAGGFGVQLHYGSPEYPEQGYLVRDGDSFAIPNGFHPVVAQGGYRLYYLWFMAGPSGRRLQPFEDPRYRWVNEV